MIAAEKEGRSVVEWFFGFTFRLRAFMLEFPVACREGASPSDIILSWSSRSTSPLYENITKIDYKSKKV